MKIIEFTERLETAKKSTKDTAQYDVYVQVSPDRLHQRIYKETVCSKCGHIDMKKVGIVFNKPHHLTIFEAGLLYALYCLDEIPRDYAQFHKCIHGHHFILDIGEVIENG